MKAASTQAKENGVNGNIDGERVHFYRQQLLLAVQGKLSADIQNQLQQLASAADE